ncbi:MAG TPA: RNA polymerase sigma factor [Prolixibacteraceae bacterium]|nr:RNA polymerase sigma factor [Prolixibacteraceae bacterium]
MKDEFIALINKHEGILQKICNIYFYRNPYKEDYYQEILIRLWKAYPSFRNDSAFSTWLYRVAINTAIDIIRKQNLRPKYTELSKYDYNIVDGESNSESDQKDKLYQAINHLSDIEKAIILLHLEAYTYKEIGEIIGISESNAGVRINRIKNQLIKILENEKR